MKDQLETEVSHLNKEIIKLNETISDIDKDRSRLAML